MKQKKQNTWIKMFRSKEGQDSNGEIKNKNSIVKHWKASQMTSIGRCVSLAK